MAAPGVVWTLAAASVLALTATTIAADNNIGTWKFNVAKSKFSPGPAVKSQTLKIEAWGDDGVKYVADGVDAEGKAVHWELQAKYDGTFHAFKGHPDADMLAYKRIDAYTVEATTQRAGKATGKTVNNLAVYERQ